MTVLRGDCLDVLPTLGDSSVDLVVTSPPYFNAKPECHVSDTYGEYLAWLGDVFGACLRVVAEGRFMAVNTSPVLVKRSRRDEASRRLPITFDLHAVLDRIGFEFVDDIIWRKPEGAGWSLGRGRRFSADRQPLQYKPVTVTENVVVYRKRTDKLIDWNIRRVPKALRDESRIGGDYERTNVWELQPARRPDHPAVFPVGLAGRLVRYYSFKGDVVLDPFAGSGTTLVAALLLGRKPIGIEISPEFAAVAEKRLQEAGNDLFG